MMTAQRYQSANGIFATRVAVVSFVVGTVFFFGAMLFPLNPAPMLLGFISLIVAITYNGIMLLVMVHDFITNRAQRDYYAGRIGIILCNIPIAVFYFYCFIGLPQLD